MVRDVSTASGWRAVCWKRGDVVRLLCTGFSFLREFDSAACQGGVCRLMGATCSLVRALSGVRAARSPGISDRAEEVLAIQTVEQALALTNRELGSLR